MGHNANVVQMGKTESSSKDVTQHNSDPATYVAGTAVRLKSDDTLSVTKAHGQLLGISLGRSLANTKRTAVCRAGLGVPILLTDDSADYAYVVKGAPVYIDDVTGKANIVDDGSVTTTISNAVYTSGVLTGIAEDGTEVAVALVDYPGGL